MFNENVKFWNSIVSKSAVFFTVIIVSSLFLSGYLINQRASLVINDYSREQIIHTSNLIEKSFHSMVNEVENDIALISKSPLVAEYINNPDGVDYEDLEHFFHVILMEKPNYFQIRLLDVQNNGKELIKFIKDNQGVQKVSSSEFQYKGEKQYFKEAMGITGQNFYYSEINLNEEFGKVSDPHTPTLRAIGKGFNVLGELKVLLVINVDVSAFFEEVSRIAERGLKTFIINDKGEYKYAQDISRCFGEQLGTGIGFSDDYFVDLSSLLEKTDVHGQLIDKENIAYLYHIEELLYSEGLKKLYVVNIASREDLLSAANQVSQDSLIMVTVVCLLILVVIFMYANYYTKKLNQVTTAIGNYEKEGTLDSNLTGVKSRNDEIGMLARSFSSMRMEIDAQVIKLKQSLSREQKAVSEKNEFLQNMSHELRTPLNAILGLTQLLNRNNPSKAQMPIIESLRRSTNTLNGLMHDILDEQKLLEGKIALNPVATNIDERLKETVASYQYEAVNKNLQLELKTSDNLKRKYYLIDPLRLNQIVTNLLVNALKYTQKGEIKIIADIDEDNGGNLVVDVIDTGQGINPENLGKLKERFFRDENEATLRVDGFGLGLSIVKNIVDLFKGSLKVKSEYGVGSKFTFSIPLEKASQEQAKATNDVYLPDLNNSYHILHIEDELSSQYLIKSILDIKNINISCSSTLQEAVDAIRNERFDLIITDLMMDAQLISGFVKEELSKLETPILILSAFDPSQYTELCDEYLQKPIDLNELEDCVISLIGKKEFDVPNFKSIYMQYDNRKDKIVNYLNLLLEEFGKYLSRLKDVYISKDQKGWIAFKHKIVTHIRALDLHKTNDMMPDQIEDLGPESFQFLTDQINYILCYVRNEMRITSVS